MNKIWFTSDIHGYHKNIAGPAVSSWDKGYRNFEDEFYMTTHLVDEINRVVAEDDILYCLGDWSFGGIDNIYNLRKRLNVKTIHLIYGNHDDHIKKNKPVKTEDGFVNAQHFFTSVQDVLTVKLGGKEFFMSHYSHQVWAASHKNVKHLFGHCVDKNTELLTHSGWKKYSDILKDDKVYSFNKNSNKLEQSAIKNIFVYPNYSGDVYTIDTNRFSIRCTNLHKIVGFDDKGWIEKTADTIFTKSKRIKIIRSGVLNEEVPLPLNDNELSLYISLVADGSTTRSGLGRLKVSKNRKIQFFKNLLYNMKITYSENIHADGATCLNFKTPESILKLNIKGLDERVANLSCKKQANVIFETYRNTDGKFNLNGNTLCIYTSKLSEVNILQKMFTINGYMCSFSSRSGHGFSKKPSYTLTVTPKELQSLGSHLNYVNKSSVVKELFWCVETELGNFICRRNGKVYVTGNSHASLEGIGRSMDVGVDSAYKLLGEYRPFSLEEVVDILNNKQVEFVDHHNSRTNR